MKSKRAFGPDQLVFVVYEDHELWSNAGMERLRELADDLAKRVRGIGRVDALDQMPVPWKVDQAAEALVSQPWAVGKLIGAFSTVASEVAKVSSQPDQLAEFRKRICAHPLLRNQLVDPTGATTALVVRFEEPSDGDAADEFDPKQVVRLLREQADRFGREHGLGHVAIVGPPVLLADGFISLEKDNRSLGLVAMALMGLTMLIAVRSPWWALLPLASGWVTWLILQAFMTRLGLELTLSSGPIVAQTVVLCMPAASHLAVRFRELLQGQLHREEAARQTLIALAVPVAWCSLTAAAGYLATLTSSVRPVYQFGLTMAISNLVAGLVAYVLSAGAMRKPRRSESHRSALGERVGGVTSWVLSHPGMTLACFALPCAAIALGAWRLEVESNYINVYRSGSRVWRDYHFVEDRLGGIGLVELVLPAPAQLTPGWLEELDQLAHELGETDPVSGVLSLADVLSLPRAKAESTRVDQPEQSPSGARSGKSPGLLGGLFGNANTGSPDPNRVLQTKLLLLRTPAYEHYLHTFWNPSQRLMRVLVRIREATSAERKEEGFRTMLRAAQSYLDQTKDQAQPGPAAQDRTVFVTGLSHLMTQVTHATITTAFRSSILSCVMILLMLLLALRSIRLAVLALAPTLFSVGLVLGAMGWMGLKIDMSTALVAAVAIGLSVDDTFHCLLRWKREQRRGHSALEALQISYAGSGPGVVLSSAAVSVGFLALVWSEFLPTANFGWLVSVATLGGSLGNLVVLPACLALLEGRRRAVAG